ncbi:hypothetical protein D3C71_2159750 [compost metagenome]
MPDFSENGVALKLLSCIVVTTSPPFRKLMPPATYERKVEPLSRSFRPPSSIMGDTMNDVVSLPRTFRLKSPAPLS